MDFNSRAIIDPHHNTTDYYIDLNNLLKLGDIDNAFELAVIEESSSNYGLIDYMI